MFDNALKEELLSDAKSVWPKRWDVIEPAFDRCSFAIAYDMVFNRLELFSAKGDIMPFDEIRSRINLFNDAEYLLRQLLEILCEKEVLKKCPEGYVCLKTGIVIESPSELLVNAARTIPEEGASFQWLSRSYGGLHSFIKGKTFGEETMFPYSDFSLVEELYYTSDVYNYWSKLSGKTVKRLIDGVFKKKVKIIEIGAGTGNGTWSVLQNLEDACERIERYLFTDINRSLIKKAGKSERFAGYDFIDYMVFDITKDPVEQGIEKNSFDVVLAVNVLHATPVLTESLRALYELVKDEGYVVLGEIAPPENRLYSYMELTFGLLASYYGYRDKERRPECPIIRQNVWVDMMKETGFGEVEAVPGDSLPGIDRGGVIIAKK